MSLGDGAGQGLVISVYNHLPPLDEVLELPDCCEDGQEFTVEGGIQRLGVRESTAEEGEWLEPPSMVLEVLEVGSVGGWRCWRHQW